MSSGRLADYLGKGAATDRPVTLDLHPEAVGFYYATDTETWSAWDGTGWVPVVVGGVPAADEVTYDNTDSGLSAADVQAAIDEVAQAAGGIADAPSDGTLYGRKDGVWAEVPGGGQDTGYATMNVQTGAAYTLALSDAGALVTMNNAAANTLTVPPNSAVAFPVGTRVDIGQDGAGQTTIAAGSGVTIRTPETLKLRKQWAKATLIKRDTNTWDLEGNLEASP